MTLTWHGHACFELKSADGSVIFDPYAPGSVPGLELPPLTADLTVCSHNHADHFSPDSVKPTGFDPMIGFHQELSFHDESFGMKRGNNVITLVQAEGVRFVHLGDLGHPLPESKYKALGDVHVLMVPVGGYYTIDATQAKQICDSFDPVVVIPMHYKGDGVGLQEIAPVDDFLRLFPDQLISYLPTNTLTIERIEHPMVAVFPWPEKK